MAEIKPSTQVWQRSHNLGELGLADVGKSVTLMGWVGKRRDFGPLIFIDLRDRFGITQVVIDAEAANTAYELAKDLKQEYVISIKGKVAKRPDDMINQDRKTGAIEVRAQEILINNTADVLPFAVSDLSDANEHLRLTYRYIDLRRPSMQRNIIMRSQISSLLRQALLKQGFLDLETPYLYKSTPEGAREFLVPSRVNPERFYALPQSPQLFKQLYMVSGFDRYFQIVKCFRDEDLRADRQPEFTQLDCEMSFVDQEQVLSTFETMMKEVVNTVLEKQVIDVLPRITYYEAMDQYGSDKPDTRFAMKLIDVSAILQKTSFQVFQNSIAGGGIINAIVAKNAGDFLTRKKLDELTDLAKKHGAQGLSYMKKNAGSGPESWQSSLTKFFTEGQLSELESFLQLSANDVVIIATGPYERTKTVLGAVRSELGRELKLYDSNQFNFLWVTDFPLLEKDEASGRYLARHHPFCMPQERDLHLLDSDPEKVRACAYDMVCNGYELGGGSIRMHVSSIQEKVFSLIGLSDTEANDKFGFLLQALKLGAPPHGGIAFGLDRLAMLLCGADAIRDVIAFPKTQKASCLMTQAPSPVSKQALDDLHIALKSERS